jgi:hypothetical protein
MQNPNEGNRFSMPGAQFNGNSAPYLAWLKKNSQRITIGIILLLIAIGAFSFYRSYQERTTLLRPALEEIKTDIFKTNTENPSANLVASEVKGTSQEIRQEAEAISTDEEITVFPGKGDGLTHLARQALKEYLKNKPEAANGLKAEHKIYIEDYLRKKVKNAPEILQLTDKVSFSQDLIQLAIDEAKELTDNQLNNLQKYVLLAPSVNY